MLVKLAGGCWQLMADGVERHQGKSCIFGLHHGTDLVTPHYKPYLRPEHIDARDIYLS